MARLLIYDRARCGLFGREDDWSVEASMSTKWSNLRTGSAWGITHGDGAEHVATNQSDNQSNDSKSMPIRGIEVVSDDAGNVCLNDLWALAGGVSNKRPNDWYRGKRAKALGAALDERITEIFRRFEEDSTPSTYYVAGKGRGARTFAHPVLALDYAEYLDPAIGVEVRELFIRFKANAVKLALEILGELTAQADYDAKRIELRRTVAQHNVIAAGVAKNEAGVYDFEAYNGAGFRGLYDRTKAQLLEHKGLKPEANHLDHAGHEELAANYFKATQTVAKIKRDKINGQKAAEAAHHEVGREVRGAIERIGGVMPEDEPSLDHINAAVKRLRAADPQRAAALLPQKKRSK